MNALAEARRTADLSFDHKASFLTGVRATEYFPRARRGRASGPVWFELVPEPDNRHDATAVAIDLDQERAGYIGASIARHLHWRVRQLNLQGYACFVPGLLGDDDEVSVALPTFAELDRLVDIDKVLGHIRELYEDLPDATRQQIEDDGFHITSHLVMQEWCNRRYMAPEAGIPKVPDLDQIPPLVNRVLMEVRHEVAAVRSATARAKREAREHEREQTLQRREQERARQDREIEKLLSEGGSVTSTAATSGASLQRVRHVRDKAGITPLASGNAPRIAKARQALALFNDGVARAQIADRFGVSTEVIKSLLSLARFLEDPSSQPERYAMALQACREGWTKSTVAGKPQRYQRAVSDARDLVSSSVRMPN